MKAMAWDRILGVLGLIFAVVPWFWPEASNSTKAVATAVILWLTLVISLITSNRLNAAWILTSLGLLVGLVALGYLQLSLLQLPHTTRLLYLSLVTVSVLAIIVATAWKSSLSPLQDSVSLLRLGTPEVWDTLIKGAEEIFVCGLTLSGLVSYHGSTIEHLIRKGCRFRVIIPEEEVILSSVHSIKLQYEPPIKLKEEYYTTLAFLDQLCKEGHRQIQIRTTGVLPTVSVLIVNPGSLRATVRVCIHVYKGTLNERPFLQFSRHKHSKWYDFFERRYYIDLWESSTQWEPGARAQFLRSQQALQNYGKRQSEGRPI